MMKIMDNFLIKITKERRLLNSLNKSRKLVEPIDIDQVETVINWPVERQSNWLKRNFDLVGKVCPARYMKEWNKLLNSLYIENQVKS